MSDPKTVVGSLLRMTEKRSDRHPLDPSMRMTIRSKWASDMKRMEPDTDDTDESDGADDAVTDAAADCRAHMMWRRMTGADSDMNMCSDSGEDDACVGADGCVNLRIDVGVQMSRRGSTSSLGWNMWRRLEETSDDEYDHKGTESRGRDGEEEKRREKLWEFGRGRREVTPGDSNWMKMDHDSDDERSAHS